MKLILSGGGSGKQNKAANEKLNEIIDSSKKILYVPLAMEESDHTPDECYEWIQRELFEIKKAGIDMVTSFEELAAKNYSDYACLFIGGGNTYKLLKGIKESGSFEKINEYLANGGIIIGGSAGASIFGKDIDVIKPMDDNYLNLKDTISFDKFNGYSIFPHYPRCSYISEEMNKIAFEKYTDYIEEYSKIHETVYAIPEEDAIYIDDKSFEVIGPNPYYIFENGRSRKVEK